MPLTERNLKKIREQIRTGNPAQVMEGVRICREEEEPEILADLIRVLATDPPPSIRQAILSLFSDLRQQNAVPVLVRSIAENPSHPELASILSSFWQSRLVFHEYPTFLADLILTGDYTICLEAFTILENAYDQADPVSLSAEIKRIESGMKDMDPEKQSLVREMLRGIRLPERN